MMYEVIKKLEVLNPTPVPHALRGVSGLVIDTLKSRQRGKGAIGKYIKKLQVLWRALNVPHALLGGVFGPIISCDVPKGNE